jgi:hypothetical protein
MDEGLMHAKDRGKIWPRGIQADLSMKECESRRTLMELLERFSDEQVLRAKAYRGEVPARVRMPYLRQHGLLGPARRCGIMRTSGSVRRCSHQLNVSAGTMMEGTYLALRKWFVAMWFITS